MTDDDAVRKARPISEKTSTERDYEFLGREGRLDGYLDPAGSAERRARQASRARVLAILLALMCVLFFTITIVKIGLQ